MSVRTAGKNSSSPPPAGVRCLVGICFHVAGASKRLETVLNTPEGITSVQLGKDFFTLLLFGGWKVLKLLGNGRNGIISIMTSIY